MRNEVFHLNPSYLKTHLSSQQKCLNFNHFLCESYEIYYTPVFLDVVSST